MRRLARYALNALTVLSLLLCVATVALWVRSYWYGDIWQRYGPASRGVARITFVASGRGAVVASVDTLTRQTASALQFVPTYSETRRTAPQAAADLATDGQATWTSLPIPGVQWRVADYVTAGVRRHRWSIHVPYWVLLVAAVAFTVAPMAYRRFRSRVRPGHCPHCNYDLRATPDRCPECGAARRVV